ncbi:MAG TPA: Flp pilus assembly protein CpaB [Mycobacteriales bacterium]
MTWADLRLLIVARRRVVAAALAGLSVLFGLSALRPPAAPAVAVLAAARDLAPGVALAIEDLRPVSLPLTAVPEGALRPGAAVLGRVVAGPVRRGEPLTDVRLVGPSLLAAVPGAVAVPVRFADPGAVAVLRPGDRVDVLATPASARDAPHPGPARVVAANVVVLAVTAAGEAGLGDGALVVVACPPDVARALAAAAATERLSPALLPPHPAPPAPATAPALTRAPSPAAGPASPRASPTATPRSGPS